MSDPAAAEAIARTSRWRLHRTRGLHALIPFAAGHELIRQGRRDRTVHMPTHLRSVDRGLRASAHLPAATRASPLHRPRRGRAGHAALEIDEQTHAGMARHGAGAARLWALRRGHIGTDPCSTTIASARALPLYRRDIAPFPRSTLT
jgi:hypothetical protein